MKIVIVYDSEEKTAQITMDGKAIMDVNSVSLYKCEEDEFDFNIMRQVVDDTGVVEIQGWTCCASKDKVSNDIKSLFKKSK